MLTAAEAAAPAPAAPPSGQRNPAWAVAVQADGLSNFHKVADGIYRCAQPGAAGFRSAEKLGIKTVINLRAMHDDADEAKGTALRLLSIPINTWEIRDEDVVRVMKILAQKENGPFLIHCQHGADRTGLMCAMYRILVQGWSREKALDEMQNGGYGFHSIWQNIVKYVGKADVEAMKKAVTAPTSASSASTPPPPPAVLPKAA